MADLKLNPSPIEDSEEDDYTFGDYGDTNLGGEPGFQAEPNNMTLSTTKLNAAVRLLADSKTIPESYVEAMRKWISAGSGRMNAIEQEHALKAFQFMHDNFRRKLPSVLYRGLLLRHEVVMGILKGTPLKSESSVLSSWTTDPKMAFTYAKYHWDTPQELTGIVLAINTPSTALWLIDKKFIRVTLDDPFSHEQKEVVVQGPGISHISKSNVLAITSDDNKPTRVADYLKDL